MKSSEQTTINNSTLREFYDNKYYKDAVMNTKPSLHLWRLAKKLLINKSQCVLDVACGTGEWLFAVSKRQAAPVGIDLSHEAIEICKARMPNEDFCIGNAEVLPFKENRFDVVSCLGALEHFVSIETGLREMVRVAKSDAEFLFLVPNSNFLTTKLGIYKGTIQQEVKEETKTLAEWENLFELAGLRVKRRWRDLHILSWSWITRRGWVRTPLRATQAIALTIWPLRWQYQVYFLCKKME